MKKLRSYILLYILLILSPVCFALQGNLNGDEIINFEDFAIFANDWGNSTPNITDPNCDFDDDGKVDYNDLTVLTTNWLENNIVFHTLTTSATLGGTVTLPGIGIYSYVHNTLTNIVAEANTNYIFTNWTGSAATAGKVNDVNIASTTVLMDANYTVQVNFIFMPPVIVNQISANDVNVSVYTAEATSINFVADDNDGDILAYKIASLPTHGTLTDMSIGAGFIFSVPYTILNPKLNYANYQSEPNYIGSDSFTYKVSDDINDSNIATVSITVVSNPLDNLSFDGQGYVTVPDSNYLEFGDTFTFALWLKTKWSYGGIVSKRNTSGAGFILKLVDGVPVVCFYDANGNEKTITGVSGGIEGFSGIQERIDTGEWVHLAITHDSNSTVVYVNSEIVGYANSVFPGVSFSNTSNLKIGVDGGQCFKGELDRISWYDTALGIFGVFCAYTLEGRNEEDGGLFVVPAYTTRFNFNEGSGFDVNDMTHNLTGVINDLNHVKWIRGNALSQKPSQRLRFRERFRLDTFHFRNYREQNKND